MTCEDLTGLWQARWLGATLCLLGKSPQTPLNVFCKIGCAPALPRIHGSPSNIRNEFKDRIYLMVIRGPQSPHLALFPVADSIWMDYSVFDSQGRLTNSSTRGVLM